MDGGSRVLLVVWVLLTLANGGQTARILMLPFPFTSHVRQQLVIGTNLIEKGHEVYLLTSPTLPSLEKTKQTKLTVIEYEAAETDFYSLDQEFYLEDAVKKTVIDDFRETIEGLSEMCTNPLRDQKLFSRLTNLKFDLLIVDVFPCGRCMLVLAHRLGVPYINLVTLLEPWLLRNPSLPSATPFVYGATPYTEQMTFWERLDNVWTLLDWSAFTGVKYIEDDFLREYFYETTPVSLNYLTGKAELWLIDLDVAIDYPRALMANEVHIGGLTTKPAKSLPKDIEEFMASATDGAIVVSFGSFGANLPDKLFAELVAAFKKVHYKIIMRFPHDAPTNLPDHIKLLSWLPQNDLLGHNNTKLFITHCGANGGFESLYHGVPMIGLPMFGDQHYNAKRLAYRGFGLHLGLLTFKSDELVAAIEEVISNRSYSDNIKLASQIYRDRPLQPLERASFWIEHILKYGGGHLRSHSLEMPWYQYLMLDLLAFVTGLLVATLLVVGCVTSHLWAHCREHHFPKTKTH